MAQKISPTNQPTRINPSRSRKLPSRYRDSNSVNTTLYLFDSKITSPLPNFKPSRLIEINGLLERGVFEIIDKYSAPKSPRIFGSRFCDIIKNQGTEKAFEESGLVVQTNNDAGKRDALTQSPKIQRSSQRLALSLSLILPSVDISLRDISQAYTQSTSNLARDIFVYAPNEMNLPRGTI
ncbi:hypothetical protein K3495_g10455 [Podosphaera aphanis]|nr:hypothetical protein K3495_g10455 [Podosphaera aphanis]